MRAKHVRRLLLVFTVLCGSAHAADPKFQSTIVADSRVYQRQSASFSVVGVPGKVGKTVDVSRITVALDGFMVTGEWEPKTSISVSAKDFRRGTDVLAAVERNRLLLKTAAGDVVTAKIVSREKQQR
jgi:hypothetical protein